MGAKEVRRVSVVGVSGSGKSTFGRRLAERIEAPYVELDALHHGAGWTEATADELRASVAPLVAGERWVIDGNYRGKLGDLVVVRADTVVWLDLPVRVWLPRLAHRKNRRDLESWVAAHPNARLVRLRSSRDVERWLASL
jgi:adenylate kinase family enzyme